MERIKTAVVGCDMISYIYAAANDGIPILLYILLS